MFRLQMKKGEKMDKTKPIRDCFQAFLVEGAEFTDAEEYPIIPSCMISTEIPKEIIPLDKITSKRDISNTYICFYEPDEEFEKVRKNPARFLPIFKKAAGIITPDFSIHSDMPLIKQKAQRNDNLSLAYYYLSHGVKGIINVREGVDEINDDYFSALPRRTLVSIGTHGFVASKAKEAEIYCFVERIVEELNPTGIVVYGPLPESVRQSFPDTPFYVFEPWINKNRRRRKHV